MSESAFGRWALLLAGALTIGLVVVITGRLSVDFALEWQEGGYLDHLRRWSAGEPLYGEPSLEGIAFPYPPLFALLGRWSLALFGDSLASLRLVSVVATAALLAGLARLASRLSRGDEPASSAASRTASWIALAVFVAGYRFTGAWLDLARVDALSLACWVWGWERWRSARGPSGVVASGLLFAAAILAKQNAALLPVALALGPVPRALAAGKSRALLLLSAWFPPLAIALYFHVASDGASTWLVFEQLVGHAWHAPAIWGTWVELTLALPLALMLAVSALSRRADFAWGSVALLAMAWLGRVHSGGYDNTLLPALLVAALWIAVGGVRWARTDGRRSLLALATSGQAAWLLAGASFPLGYLPTLLQTEQAQAIREALVECPEPRWLPYCPELSPGSSTAGAHGMAVLDLLRSGDEQRALGFVQQLEAALAEARWGAILVPDSWRRDLPALEQHYRVSQVLPWEPVTGAVHSPLWLWVPR